jgi:glutamate formiminotransferase / formiminotetrahydrofolate cyclodeaminase
MTNHSLVECVPNFSEGRRPEVIHAIRDAIAGVQGVTILDVSSDPSHNRTVITFVAPPSSAVDAAFAGMREAQARIDLTKHEGEHPRIGATDVVPFIPLEGTTMEDCIALARQLGARVGAELGIPVYLYERAATTPARENLADVRRGEFEGLRTTFRPADFGPAAVHPTAGATAIGARPFLVAYNVYLGPSTNLSVAKEVAKAVRGSSGGLRYVKALGLEVDGQAQVSMNLVDIDRTPLSRAYEAVRTEAAAYGVTPTWSELVGLVPERALLDAGARHVQLRNFTPDQLLERRVRKAVDEAKPDGNATEGEPSSLDAFIASVGAPTPTPGGGSVVAIAAALAASLTGMVAGLTAGRPKYAAVEPEMRKIISDGADLTRTLRALADRDAEAYAAVSAAYKLPKGAEGREAAITAALMEATRVPLETAHAAAKVAALAVTVAEKGNPNAVSDAGVAALLAEAACRGAAYNVRINVASLPDRTLGDDLAAQAIRLVEATSASSAAAAAEVERHL